MVPNNAERDGGDPRPYPGRPPSSPPRGPVYDGLPREQRPPRPPRGRQDPNRNPERSESPRRGATESLASLEQFLNSDAIQRILELTQANVELEAENRIQQIETEAQLRIAEIEASFAHDRAEQAMKRAEQMTAEAERRMHEANARLQEAEKVRHHANQLREQEAGRLEQLIAERNELAQLVDRLRGEIASLSESRQPTENREETGLRKRLEQAGKEILELRRRLRENEEDSRSERRSLPKREVTERLFQKYDVDGDGRLSRTEWKKMLIQPTGADLNEDGFLTVEEYLKFRSDSNSE